MSLTLHTIAPHPASRKSRRRVGRGNGSRGTTAGRGTKGQRSRTGGRRGMIRRSLRMLMERVAKQRGFSSRHPKLAVVNVQQLGRFFSKGEIVTPEALRAKNLVTHIQDGVKVLGSGSIEQALTVKVHAVSESARTAIEKAGGSVVIIGRRLAKAETKKEG